MEKYIFVHCEKEIPTEITYGYHKTHFGLVLLAVTEHGICHLSFVEETSTPHNLDELQKHWPHSTLKEDAVQTQSWVELIFADSEKPSKPIHVLLKGSEFQKRVWQALLSIPVGSVVSYSQLADSVGMPRAVRAVASQIAKNEIAYIIPCHRVIRKSGNINQYRWGVNVKRALLEHEGVEL